MTHGLSDRLAHWTSALVRIPSVNPVHAGPKAGCRGERAIALALAGWLEGFGARVEVSDVVGRPPERLRARPGPDRAAASCSTSTPTR